MKNLFFVPLTLLLILIACSKNTNDIELQSALEERSNDNHKIWKLSEVTNLWDYTLSNGFQSNGKNLLKYVYSCSRPVGRAISSTDFGEENGVIYWDISRTISYNDNFMVNKEKSLDLGDEVVRTYLYDSNNKWTGITTEVNGVIVEDEIDINPFGQVISYTSDGVRTEYEWKADNITKIKTFVRLSESLSTVKNSLVYHQLGFDISTKNKAREQILSSFNKMQKLNRTSSLRSNNTDEWLLVFIEEQTVDKNVIQPFSSTALGYPGTSSDGGYLILPKNLIINFKGYNINEDGSPGDLSYLFSYTSYTTKDNLPVDVKYTSFVAAYETDEEGHPLDYNDHGTIHYTYISGCNQ